LRGGWTPDCRSGDMSHGAALQGDQAMAGDKPAMQTIGISCGPLRFTGRFEDAAAPKTCEAFRAVLPYRQRIIHVRWSGEACWIPLGDFDFGLGYENHTSYPAPGQILLYPGGISETEILLAYGAVQFASKMGQLAGNHFLTIESGLEDLARLGKKVLWEGAQEIVFGD
jgi:hypothetical protein